MRLGATGSIERGKGRLTCTVLTVVLNCQTALHFAGKCKDHIQLIFVCSGIAFCILNACSGTLASFGAAVYASVRRSSRFRPAGCSAGAGGPKPLRCQAA